MSIFSNLFGDANTDSMSSSDLYDTGKKFASTGLITTPPPIQETPLTFDQWVGLSSGINEGNSNNGSS